MATVLSILLVLLTCLAGMANTMQPADISSREMEVPAAGLDSSAPDGHRVSHQYTTDGREEADTDRAFGLPVEASTLDACRFLCSCDSIRKRVDCSARNLNVVPRLLPSDVQHLDLSWNNISELANWDVQSLPYLVTLDLSHNKLRHLPVAVFSNNHNLQALFLQDNHLENIYTTCSDPESASLFKQSNESSSNSTQAVAQLCNMTGLQLLNLAHNALSFLPGGILDVFPQLESLLLDDNDIGELPNMLSHQDHTLRQLGLNGNSIHNLNCTSMWHLVQLQVADFGNNRLVQIPNGMCSKQLPKLRTLTLSGNPINALAPGAFTNMSSLSLLHLTHLRGLRYLPKHAFIGLTNLTSLNISHSSNLRFIHSEAFEGVDSLKVLDLSYCDITWMSRHLVENITFTLKLDGNPWHCDCDLVWLSEWLMQRNAWNKETPPNIECSQPASLTGKSLLNNKLPSAMVCEAPDVVEGNTTLWFKIASGAVIDCLVSGQEKTKITWITSKKQIFLYDPRKQDLYSSDPDRPGYHDGHYWHNDRSYHDLSEQQGRISVLYNGSLYIDYVTRVDAGNYTCIADNGYLNETVIIEVRLAYAVLSWLKLYTMIWGFFCAFTFFFVAMVTSAIRYYTFQCSTEERRKRKSIREVLDSLQDFKTIQIDRLCAYKTAKINKFSAFKTDKMHKLVAFKSAKIDKLRTYKQVTVASIFHHLEKMREHYNYQMNRVKDNCTQQVEKLRENYTNQVGRIKDYKSEKMDQIRDNYNSQVMKIKEYRAFQMNKLREQYKLQQQHLLKLMELLDIGNCLHIVEAECMRTESMIFDPNISIDLEAEPVHVQRDMDFSDVESEYVTAGSQSDMSVSDTMITADVLPPQYSRNYRPSKLNSNKPKQNNKRAGHRVSSSSDTSSDQSQSSPSQFCVQVIPEPLPAPPAFSYDKSEINIPLDELVGSMESDAVGMYQTPPTSAHPDGSSKEMAGGDMPPQTSHGRRSVTDSTSTAYDTAEQSREQSPQPSDTGCDQATVKTEPTAKDAVDSEAII